MMIITNINDNKIDSNQLIFVFLNEKKCYKINFNTMMMMVIWRFYHRKKITFFDNDDNDNNGHTFCILFTYNQQVVPGS